MGGPQAARIARGCPAPGPAGRYNGIAVGEFYTCEQLVAARAAWRRAGRRVVFTNGCYDILHPGHIRLLEKARSMGDLLILALNTDAGVRRLKGPSRPLIAEQDRVSMARV